MALSPENSIIEIGKAAAIGFGNVFIDALSAFQVWFRLAERFRHGLNEQEDILRVSRGNRYGSNRDILGGSRESQSWKSPWNTEDSYRHQSKKNRNWRRDAVSSCGKCTQTSIHGRVKRMLKIRRTQKQFWDMQRLRASYRPLRGISPQVLTRKNSVWKLRIETLGPYFPDSAKVRAIYQAKG